MTEQEILKEARNKMLEAQIIASGYTVEIIAENIRQHERAKQREVERTAALEVIMSRVTKN